MQTAEELIRQLRAPDQRGVGRVDAAENGPSNINRLAELDETAATIRVWDSTIIPGNLQTPEYSEAVIRAAHPRMPDYEVRRRMYRKEQRARAFLRRTFDPDAGTAWYVIGERAITQCIHLDEDSSLHIGQLWHLTRIAAHQRVILQVLPDSVVTPNLADQFTLYGLDENHRVGYVETIMGSWYSTRIDDVTKLQATFIEIMGEAMSPTSTRQFIREVLGSWRSLKKESPEPTEGNPSSSAPSHERVMNALESQDRARPAHRTEP